MLNDTEYFKVVVSRLYKRVVIYPYDLTKYNVKLYFL